MAALNGKYPATLTGQGALYEKDNGNLICALVVAVEGLESKYHFTLSTPNDGIKQRAVDDLRKILTEWSGDIGELYDIVNSGSYAGREVVATCEPQKDKPQYTQIKWLNPPGGGSALVPQSTDRSALLKKYGAQFRAVAGPKKVGPPAKPAAPPAAPPAAAPKASKPAAKTSTLNECWQALTEKMADSTEEQINAAWYKLIGGEDVNPADIKPAQWGKILVAITDDIPC